MKGLFQAKGKVDPRKQMMYGTLFAMIPFTGFILFFLVETFELVSQRGLWLLEERIAIFASSPFLVMMPFARIGKTAKSILLVIPLWLASMTFVITVDALMYDVIAMIAAIAIMTSIFIATSTGHYVTKWSKEWNKKLNAS